VFEYNGATLPPHSDAGTRSAVMDEHRPMFAVRSNFGRRRVTPHAVIADRKAHIRKFLGEALEDLGFTSHGCAHLGDLRAALTHAVPDLIVIGLAGGAPDGVAFIEGLAAEAFDGKVLLIGAREQPALAAIQRVAKSHNLDMLPPLGTPYRDGDLRARLADLLPVEGPPKAPVDVAEALAAGWLDVWYQAKIDVRSLLPCGAEALVRLRHPAWGAVPPACFIPDAADPHFRALADFVVARAMADWVYFATRYAPVKLAIKLPIAVLEDPCSVERLRLQLPDHPAFEGLIVGISGADIAGNIALAREAAWRLQLHNIGISIDAGRDDDVAEWPSLAALASFPFVELKVDGKFVAGCADDPLKRAACRTMLDLAGRFGVRTVASGVERRADFRAVKEMGFDLVQGLLFQKPMAATRFARAVLACQPVEPASSPR